MVEVKTQMTELYDRIGAGYTSRRRPDPRIQSAIRKGLDDCRSVVNVGAGTGSYEPDDLRVFPVEPSWQMISQRTDHSRVVQGKAEELPLRDDCADAVMGVLTIHHWRDKAKGLAECARVARKRLVLMTWDPDSKGFWLKEDYLPELHAHDRTIFPSMSELESVVGRISVEALPIPADCVDGFLGAYWRRPEAYLDENVRSGMSSFARVPEVEARLAELKNDLDSGAWLRRHGSLLEKDELDLGYRLVTAMIA